MLLILNAMYEFLLVPAVIAVLIVYYYFSTDSDLTLKFVECFGKKPSKKKLFLFNFFLHYLKPNVDFF